MQAASMVPPLRPSGKCSARARTRRPNAGGKQEDHWLLNYVGWRSLFGILTIGTFAVSGLIYMVVPERAGDSQIASPARKPLTLWSVYSDPRFLRVAPLSATCIGSGFDPGGWQRRRLLAVSRFGRSISRCRCGLAEAAQFRRFHPDDPA
jgi:hypothetical protein